MNNQSKGNCCTYVQHVLLIILLILFFITFYSIDETVLSIGEIKNNITRLNNQDISTLECNSLCELPYVQPYSISYCCANSAVFSTCKAKQQCNLELVNKYQNDLNNEYLNLLFQSGVELIIIIIFTVYCVRKRIQKARRQRQMQQNLLDQGNNHAALFNYVGSLYMRQQYEPASLDPSFFLNQQGQCLCPICLQTFNQVKVIKLKCDHTFHSQCIKSWMQTKNTCPICRTKN